MDLIDLTGNRFGDVIVARLDKLKWNTEDALTKPIQRRTK